MENDGGLFSSLGRTDRMDQNVAAYCTGIRWWRPLFLWYVDVAIQNGCLRYRKLDAAAHEQLDLLHFSRAIVQVYAKSMPAVIPKTHRKTPTRRV